MLNAADTVLKTELPLPFVARGKVRDIYQMGEDKLLIVTTDRLSAFDVVMPNPIPNKGKVLTQISVFWLGLFSKIVPNHLISTDIRQMDLSSEVLQKYGAMLEGRTMLVKKAKPFPVECIVRGYVTGSGWKDYQKTGAICGHVLPANLKQCEKLVKPIFTPSTKAEVGHDENISREQAAKMIGKDAAQKLEELSIKIYQTGADYAEAKGILIADTKFEFGVMNGEIILIDEIMSPDSSRFWPKDKYETGHDQPSFDKQIVRNYLSGLDWNKQPPAPELPQHIVDQTSRAYCEAYERLVGKVIG
ncbi:MAG: phosphoribosylaminoimidazolesuccinocarboxamide synthase [Candidatus Omnitrophica bacterium]|nr:phosphoribosylaminoimidazolesuccinocarboxamide synthase [Candidatus Omnitrophota bacterium]